MKIEIVNKSNNHLPVYETEFSAGMDIRAFLPEDIEIKPLQRTLVSTGIFIAIPEGHEAQIRPRSGLAVKNGISVLNAPGTIDADYRGEVKVLLINLSDQPFIIRSGDRIAQMIVAPFTTVEWEKTESLDETVRGVGGFGHTGL